MRQSYLVTVLAAAALAAPAAAQPVSAVDVNELKVELRQLKQRVQDLERDLARLRGGPAAPGKGGLAARFSAAEAISSVAEQQSAFAVLAVEAAKVGDVKLTKQALARLTSVATQQEQTYKAALHLARAGQTEEAVTLAKSLSSVSQSQKALTKIAKGELDD
jgi:hypothetical protein